VEKRSTTGSVRFRGLVRVADSTIAQESASVVYPELTSFVFLGRFVETKIAADVTTAVTVARTPTGRLLRHRGIVC